MQTNLFVRHACPPDFSGHIGVTDNTNTVCDGEVLLSTGAFVLSSPFPLGNLKLAALQQEPAPSNDVKVSTA